MEMMMGGGPEQKAFGYAAKDSSGLLSPFHFTRRANGDRDITMKVLYCGICHSDLDMITNKHGISSYPIVPGSISIEQILFCSCV
ncbi:hypothetical protein MLD38_019226 [Melastoma candidum]|uniref:Uncharacterized protein n=1 Tax=Melastoma candidum TaxID=119954 RepID=A0ACB9QWB7_9MYRT|nr:hypothetical protein MLD38_019226 [Melastoma candidum]